MCGESPDAHEGQGEFPKVRQRPRHQETSQVDMFKWILKRVCAPALVLLSYWRAMCTGSPEFCPTARSLLELAALEVSSSQVGLDKGPIWDC